MNEFVCKRCGRCCGLVPFERHEYKSIMRLAHRMNISFVKSSIQGHTVYFVRSIVQKVQKAGPQNMNPQDMTCPFRGDNGDGTTSCKIYDMRPMICKKFGDDWKQGEFLRCPYDDRDGVKNSMAKDNKKNA